ncbi:MAG TPA: carbohydrate porin [Acidobacteriaceae bacterium]|nr:carbohydrate porin [Acidobacteriaceae bacterium]
MADSKMNEIHSRVQGTNLALLLLAICFVLLASTRVSAQVTQDTPKLPVPPPPQRSIEDLNYLAGDASVPSFSDSILSPQGEFRQSLFRKGMALRLVNQDQYVQNTLASPVPPDNQVYIGQHPFEGAMVQPILTWDLRQLHLRRAQLYAGGVWNWVSWNPAGPKSFQLWDLYFYKGWGRDRVQMKAGYISMNLEFVGLFVGGSTATGGQGVYAVLPYEVGMSYFPLTSPAASLRARGPDHLYVKSAAQRSIDPAGGPAEVARNATGFRFLPHGDKLLLINEAGYLRDAAKDVHETWFRAGYLYNTTRYKNVATGQPESGNYCAYALVDHQFIRTSLEHPDHGIYAGASYMNVPEALNSYSRYYEARFYKEAPLERRPADLVSFVASHTGYSRVATNSLVAQGKTVWRSGSTLTGSYAVHVSPGNFVGVGMTYLYGPAVTPRVPSALNFLVSWTTYF